MYTINWFKLLPIGIPLILLASCSYDNARYKPIKTTNVESNHQYPKALPLRYSKQANPNICPLPAKQRR